MVDETECRGCCVPPEGADFSVQVRNREMVGAGVRPGDSLYVVAMELQGEPVTGRLYLLRVRSGDTERMLVRYLALDKGDGTLWALAHGEGGIEYVRLDKLGDKVTVLGYAMAHLHLFDE